MSTLAGCMVDMFRLDLSDVHITFLVCFSDAFLDFLAFWQRLKLSGEDRPYTILIQFQPESFFGWNQLAS